MSALAPQLATVIVGTHPRHHTAIISTHPHHHSVTLPPGTNGFELTNVVGAAFCHGSFMKDGASLPLRNSQNRSGASAAGVLPFAAGAFSDVRFLDDNDEEDAMSWPREGLRKGLLGNDR